MNWGKKSLPSLWGPTRVSCVDPEVNKAFDEKLEEIENSGFGRDLIDNLCPSPVAPLLSEDDDVEAVDFPKMDLDNDLDVKFGELDLGSLDLLLMDVGENTEKDKKNNFEAKMREAIRFVDPNLNEQHVSEMTNFVWKALEGLKGLGIKCEKEE